MHDIERMEDFGRILGFNEFIFGAIITFSTTKTTVAEKPLSRSSCWEFQIICDGMHWFESTWNLTNARLDI